MIIMLQPEQITSMWDLIKHGVIQANRLTRIEDQQRVCNNILQQLLSANAQCWIVYEKPSEEEKHLYAFAITCVQSDALTGLKYLYIHTVYGWRRPTQEMRDESMEAYKVFARRMGCSKILTTTYVDRLKEELIGYGYTQDLGLFVLDL